MKIQTRWAPATQGVFYIATGLWPILHLRSFERVTGPKVDGWLVQTIGGLIAAVGAALLVGAREGRRSPALTVLGVGSACALGAADLLFSTRGRISSIYAADAVAEAALCGLWLGERRVISPRACHPAASRPS